MPVLICVGSNSRNKSRVTQRGYVIRRSGKVVSALYGAIDVIKGKYYWAGRHFPRTDVNRFGSEEAAKAFLRQRVREQLAQRYSGYYTKLPPGVRIRAYSRSPRRYI
jgi:hypothetical protein